MAHEGTYWQFPTSTSCPKPVQEEVPIWVAARSPITFDYAVEQECNIMSWPLHCHFQKQRAYRERLDDAIERIGKPFKGQWAMMRHTSVYENDDKQAALDAVRSVLAMFGNLMMKSGDVTNGFPEKVPLDQLEGNVRVDPEMLAENLMFGTPDEVIAKLRAYQGIGVDAFIYYASMGMDRAQQKEA